MYILIFFPNNNFELRDYKFFLHYPEKEVEKLKKKGFSVDVVKIGWNLNN